MDWFAPIDLYCERTAPGLFNEPLNAVVLFLALTTAIRFGNGLANTPHHA
jgi:hypothetical protein